MKKAVYKHLLRTYGRLPLLWLGILGELIRSILLRVVTVIVVAKIASDIVSGNFEGVKYNILVFIVVNVVGSVTGVLGEMAAAHATDKRYETLLLDYHKKLTGKDMSFYRDHQTGYLSSLFRQHLDGTMTLVRLIRSDFVKRFVSLVFPVIVLFSVNWKFGLIAALLVLVEATYLFWASSLGNKYRKASQEVYRKLTGEVADEVTNAVAFKSGGQEQTLRGKVVDLAQQETRLFLLRHRIVTLLELPVPIITSIGVGLTLYLMLSSGHDVPAFVSLILLSFTYLFQIMRNVSDLPDLIYRHDEWVARIYPTLEYLDNVYETINDPAEPQELKIHTGSIEIKNIDFAYKNKVSSRKNHKVFSNLNISIAGGERVGIVGLSGAGKSSLANLLMRFDEIDEGSISIDGIDIRNVRQSELRQKIAYIPQEPILFHRTIRENITYFKSDATDEEVVAAAKSAHAHEFISKVEEGYSAMVGERGVKLSGGQKQRIVIARAILKNAPIMIFDEATSALDSESEQIIQKALPAIINNHTAIVIAHRLSTVAWLDRIIVMHDGKVVETGTHKELLEKAGKYYSFWQKQTVLKEEMI